MGKRYQNNMADQDLIVRSIQVLEDIDGGGMREIRQNIENVKRHAAMQSKQQEQYWKTLSDDGVISSVEKQSLKREMDNIGQSFSAVTQQAASFGYTNPILTDYVNTYNALYAYIYDNLKLFDDMTTDTPISDRAAFNQMFSNYFFLENFILLAITKGVLDVLSFRVLENLQEEGEEGEIALYHGGLYQYTDNHWKSVSTGNYVGVKNELPPPVEDSFFLASETFVEYDVLIVNGEELEVNGEPLYITHSYIKGYIYYVEDGYWNVEEDKTNWRYAAAFADVLNITGELPQIFQEGLDALQAQLDEEIQTRIGQFTIINGEIVQITAELATKVSHIPKYLGGSNTLPQTPQEGDFFTWTGGNLSPWYTGKVYLYTGSSWTGPLDETNPAYRSYFMLALEDILASNAAGEGYFSAVFASAFFGNAATLASLSVRTIYLRYGGNIQSDYSQYSQETLGLNIDYRGNIDANGDTHLGGKVAIGVPRQGNPDFGYYDVVIGGNTKVTGRIDATYFYTPNYDAQNKKGCCIEPLINTSTPYQLSVEFLRARHLKSWNEEGPINIDSLTAGVISCYGNHINNVSNLYYRLVQYKAIGYCVLCEGKITYKYVVEESTYYDVVSVYRIRHYGLDIGQIGIWCKNPGDYGIEYKAIAISDVEAIDIWI